jgi:hypothetical protein
MAYNFRKKNNGWNVDSVKIIYSKDSNNFYTFRVEKWVEKNQKINAIISPDSIVPIVSGETTTQSGAGAAPAKMIYHISTITGDHKFAGTDAKVYIQLKGTEGNSEIHHLYNPKARKQQFERGQMDHFHVSKYHLVKLHFYVFFKFIF